MVYLTEPQSNEIKKLLAKKDMEHYIGSIIPNIEEFVQGNLDFVTLQPRFNCNLNFAKILNFFAWKPKPQLGFLNNLCAKQITFDNFDQMSYESLMKSIREEAKSETDKQRKELENKIQSEGTTSDNDLTNSVSTKISPKKSMTKAKTAALAKKIRKINQNKARRTLAQSD